MRCLLDTDTLSNLCRKSPSAFLVRRLAAVPMEDQSTSSISVGELFYGAHRNASQREVLLETIQDVLGQDLVVVPFDDTAARVYGALRHQLESAGTPIGEGDTRIAAIALAYDLTVVTGNVRHFQRVPGLRVENWFEPA